MKPSFQIPIIRTFVNWIITIIVASFLWPIISGMYAGSEINPAHAGITMIGSFVCSSVTSIPALIIFLIMGVELNQRNLTYEVYIKKHIIIQLIMALFTLLFLFFLNDELFIRESTSVMTVAFTYFGVGLITWFITFSNYKSNDVVKEEKMDLNATELLDDTINQTDSDSLSR